MHIQNNSKLEFGAVFKEKLSDRIGTLINTIEGIGCMRYMVIDGGHKKEFQTRRELEEYTKYKPYLKVYRVMDESVVESY